MILLSKRPRSTLRVPPASRQEQARFPQGWNEARVRKVLEHYEQQTEEEAVAEDEAALEQSQGTVMEVPTDVVPRIRQLIARRGTRRPGRPSRAD